MIPKWALRHKDNFELKAVEKQQMWNSLPSLPLFAYKQGTDFSL